MTSFAERPHGLNGVGRREPFGIPRGSVGQPDRTFPPLLPSQPADVNRRLSDARVGSTTPPGHDRNRNLVANLPSANAGRGEEAGWPVDKRPKASSAHPVEPTKQAGYSGLQEAGWAVDKPPVTVSHQQTDEPTQASTQTELPTKMQTRRAPRPSSIEREQRLEQLVDFAHSTNFSHEDLAGMYEVSKGLISQDIRILKDRGLIPNVDGRQVEHKPRRTQQQIREDNAAAIARRNRATGDPRVIAKENRLEQVLDFAKSTSYTQDEIAGMYGVSRRAINRYMTTLKERGLIPDVDGRQMKHRTDRDDRLAELPTKHVKFTQAELAKRYGVNKSRIHGDIRDLKKRGRIPNIDHRTVEYKRQRAKTKNNQ